MGLPLKKMDETDCNVLFLAANHNDVEGIKKAIFTLGINPETEEDGFNVLHYAANSGCLQAMKYLIEELQLNPIGFSNSGLSVLYFAIKSGNLDAITYLFKIGCGRNFDPTLEDKFRCDAFFYAEQSKNIDTVKSILYDFMQKSKATSEKISENLSSSFYTL